MAEDAKRTWTPKPWNVDESGRVLAPNGTFLKSPSQPVFVVANSVYLTGSREEQLANARLIANSPTMYEYIAKKAREGDAEAQSIIASI